MRQLNNAIRAVARLMAAVMVIVSLPLGAAQAGMVSTDQVIDSVAVADTRAWVMDFLARDDVRQQMEALGVDGDEAAARAANMTDAEVMQLAGQLEQLPAGQSAAGAVLGLFVVILIILFVTDILGLTSVYPGLK